MAKISEKPESKTAEPLLSLHTNKTVANTAKSIFDKTQAPSIKEAPQAGKEGKVHEDVIIQDVEPTIVEELVNPAPISIECYFELTYLEEGKEKVIYCEQAPVIEDSLLKVNSPFGHYDFVEIVLNKKRVAVRCKSPIKEEELVLDLQKSCLMKAIPAQEWMVRTFEETKDLFDKAVLNAYRIINQEAGGVVAAAPTGKKKVVNNQSDEQFVDVNVPQRRRVQNIDAPGNIAPDRPPGTYLQDF